MHRCHVKIDIWAWLEWRFKNESLINKKSRQKFFWQTWQDWAEQTRQKRDAFISRMLALIKLNLLIQTETTTLNILYASGSERLTLKSTSTDENARATDFISFIDKSSSSLATASNNNAAANKDLASSQRELERQTNKLQVSVHLSNSREVHRGNFPGRWRFPFIWNRENNRPPIHQGYQ